MDALLIRCKTRRSLMLTVPLEDRDIGGAGIRLAKQLMTELRYQRDNTRNHLIMIKKV